MPDENFAKAYDASQYEDAIYAAWEKDGCFRAEIDESKEPFVISMPPPNATGKLHVGHAVMLALQDIMIRHNRMLGKPTLWLPGTDHAAIATQNKVEQLLHKEGSDRHKLGREKFIERVKEYVAESQDNIRNQVRKMGSSCDWSREAYTFSDNLSHAVNTMFKKMYDDGLIYRGDRIVNWCPRCHSTLADDEVEYKERAAKFYTFRYSKDFPISISTTRPETKLGDTAVAVNPKDKRYKKFVGQTFEIKEFGGKGGANLKIKVIADPEVDMKFGTGALGVTPAHSLIDYAMSQKHGVEVIKVIDEDAKMTANAGTAYKGQKVEEAREQVVAWLRAEALLEKEEDVQQNLSVCYRCASTIEPIPSLQWFINVNAKFKIRNSKLKGIKNGQKMSLKELANHVVKSGEINIIPDRFNKTYFAWMENLRDWCISRQIWWGHRIPVYYRKQVNSKFKIQNDNASQREIYVGINPPEGDGWEQDPDTLDTWFSSGLWTFSTLGWPASAEATARQARKENVSKKMTDLEYFHPTSVMETGYDIIFFWVARMILMSTYGLGEVPFKTVYLHGLVRTRDGSKMSKSKPETMIDPLDMIAKYGADALRLSLIIGTTPGNDVKLFEEKIAGFRNFVNKLWNLARYLDSKNVKLKHAKPEIKSLADAWIISKLNILIKEVSVDLDKYALGEAGQKLYDFLWSDFADWYVEASKIKVNDQVLAYVFENTLKLLHPFVPFITEQIWGRLGARKSLILAEWPQTKKSLINQELQSEFEIIKELVTEIRQARADYKIEPAKKIKLLVKAGRAAELVNDELELVKFLARIDDLEFIEGKPQEAVVSLVVGKIEAYLPLGDMIDLAKEKARLTKESEELKKYVKGLDSKLSNKNFIKNAPAEVVAGDKGRLEDAKLKLEKLEQQLAALTS
ncbi:MAG: valine--tRNA ligase [Candidatus Gracilibacteria bacterium]|nr:valine--tRNA ligase [Candidatus Gracilibacteria bacterium]